MLVVTSHKMVGPTKFPLSYPGTYKVQFRKFRSTFLGSKLPQYLRGKRNISSASEVQLQLHCHYVSKGTVNRKNLPSKIKTENISQST
jgi:hypothetical protein